MKNESVWVRPIASGYVDTYTITQPLDHFDQLNNGTYEHIGSMNNSGMDRSARIISSFCTSVMTLVGS